MYTLFSSLYTLLNHQFITENRQFIPNPWTDSKGERQNTYADDLDALRRKERQIQKDLEDGILTNEADSITIGMVYQKYIEKKNTNIQDEKVNIDSRKANIDNSVEVKILQKLADAGSNKVTIEKAMKLYKAVGNDTVFGRTMVISVVEGGPTSATRLLNKLNEVGIVVPVRGMGKGKYKFKE